MRLDQRHDSMPGPDLIGVQTAIELEGVLRKTRALYMNDDEVRRSDLMLDHNIQSVRLKITGRTTNQVDNVTQILGSS